MNERSPKSTAWRMEAMCAALGQPMDEGHWAHEAMAERCAHCEKGGACLLWRLSVGEAAREAPGYCLNAEAIEALAAAG